MSSAQPPGGSLKCSAAESNGPNFKNPKSQKSIEKNNAETQPSSSSSKKSSDQDTLILTKTEYDPNIEHHPSLLDNLLKSSTHSEINGFYFQQLQTEIQPWMRDQVVKWMLEVIGIKISRDF